MKLLILVIYSDGENYREMLQIQRSYLHEFDNVKTYFTMFREDQSEPILIENDFVYVKGKETYLGITQKTIDSLEYLFQQTNFDYVIRTNISTILNVPLLYQYCLTLPTSNVYTSGAKMNLQWLDPPAGIVDQTLWGTKYMSGTNIVMSSDVVKDMIAHKDKIRYDIVDDVTIGLYMTKYLPAVFTPLCLENTHGNYSFSPINYPSLQKGDSREKSCKTMCPPISFYTVPNKRLLSDNVDTTQMVFRNRSDDRKLDVENMKTIVETLYSLEEGFQTISPWIFTDSFFVASIACASIACASIASILLYLYRFKFYKRRR